MAKGEHVFYRGAFGSRLLTHHGIDCGDGSVIEFGRGEDSEIDGKGLEDMRTATVQVRTRIDPTDILCSHGIRPLHQAYVRRRSAHGWLSSRRQRLRRARKCRCSVILTLHSTPTRLSGAP